MKEYNLERNTTPISLILNAFPVDTNGHYGWKFKSAYLWFQLDWRLCAYKIDLYHKIELYHITFSKLF